MGHRRRRREVGLAPLRVHRHPRRHLPQLLEARRPEVLIEVQVAVVALGCAGVRAQEVQRRPVGQHHRVALQLDARHIAHELDDVLLEDVRLRLAGRQEDLVSPRLQRVVDRLAGEVPRRPDLAALQQVADALRLPRLIPDPLVFEHRIEEGLMDRLNLLFRQVVFRRPLLRIRVAVRHSRIQVALVAAALVLPDPRRSLQLAPQQVDLLEIAAGLPVLHDQRVDPHLQRALDPLQAARLRPLVAPLPRRERVVGQPKLPGDLRHPPAHPVQRPGPAPRVEWRCRIAHRRHARRRLLGRQIEQRIGVDGRLCSGTARHVRHDARARVKRSALPM